MFASDMLRTCTNKILLQIDVYTNITWSMNIMYTYRSFQADDVPGFFGA